MRGLTLTAKTLTQEEVVRESSTSQRSDFPPNRPLFFSWLVRGSALKCLILLASELIGTSDSTGALHFLFY